MTSRDSPNSAFTKTEARREKYTNVYDCHSDADCSLCKLLRWCILLLDRLGFRRICDLCLFMHYIHIGLAPKYLSDCVSTVSAARGRYRLRSTGSEAYILPRTRIGERGFFYSGPATWNTLPSDLHDITDTSTFRKRLKNVLFDRAFN